MLLRASIIRRNTSQMINTFAPGQAHQDKIMTTATWPVPYYNRKIKAYPVRGYLKREKKRYYRNA